MIEVIKLCKRFDNRVLFSDLSFQIQTGEFVCFSGESGKGKTTLLNMIGQLEPPTSGEIQYDGEAIGSNKERLEFLRTKVSFIFQNFALVEGKTVAQNLAFVRKNNRRDISMESVLARVGLVDKINEKIYTLSGGEQQRVALARSFYKCSEIILADEPTGSLDQQNAGQVVSLLRELNAEGKTVVLVTHDERIKRICDRTIEL
ncbi:putative ABC transporter ATP-binding protein [Oscillibacter valericigenes Sjm18-20]|nr:putative ABC transporter ATP-binding protein [Oscillibacter valericigenes Sjm18-20]